MTIIEKISEKIVHDYKSGDAQRRVLLQTIKAALVMAEKDAKHTLSDEESIKILSKELKQRTDARTQYLEAKRTDLVEKMDFEIGVIKNFLPEQLSETEVEQIVKKVVSESQDKAFGPLMGRVMAEIGNRSDGSIAANILKKYL